MSQNSASELPLETREVPRRPTVAIWLSSFGGIALLLGALAFTSSGGGYGAWIPFLLLPFIALAYVSSFLVLVGAFMVNVRPEAHTVWGLIILEAGILGIGPGTSLVL